MKHIFLFYITLISFRVNAEVKSQLPSWLAHENVCNVIHYVHEKLWGKAPSDKVREVFARQPLYDTYDPANGYTIMESLPEGVSILKDFKLEVISIKGYMGMLPDHLKMIRNMLDKLHAPDYASALSSQLINGEQSITLADAGVVIESNGSNIVASGFGTGNGTLKTWQKKMDWGFNGNNRDAEFAAALAETIGLRLPSEIQKPGFSNQNEVVRFIDPLLPEQVKTPAIFYRPRTLENLEKDERFLGFKALAEEYKIRLIIIKRPS